MIGGNQRVAPRPAIVVTQGEVKSEDGSLLVGVIASRLLDCDARPKVELASAAERETLVGDVSDDGMPEPEATRFGLLEERGELSSVGCVEAHALRLEQLPDRRDSEAAAENARKLE